jgi:hypothetical protein
MTEQVQPTPAEERKSAAVEASSGKALKRKPKTTTKSDAVIALLSRSRGATIDEIMKITGWQAHSVRGFLAGTVKKKLGRSVASEASDKGRVYRITSEAK